MEICTLCLKNNATQRNSHIFPKFMGTTMLASTDGLRKGYKITTHSGINYKIFQDTPKEDYIFCPSCESLISRQFETPIANQFYNNRENPRSFFNVFMRDHYFYRVYFKLDYQLFTKFIYSIIFRACVSNTDYFKDFKISPDIQEKLRKILYENSPFESFPFLILTVPYNPKPTGNFIGAISSKKNVHLIGVNEFIIFLDLSGENLLSNFFGNLVGIKYDLVRVITVPYNLWESLIRDTVFGPVLGNMFKRLGIRSIIDGLFIHKILLQH